LPLFTLVGMVAGTALAGFWLWQRVGKRPKDEGPDNAPR
jgi:hypothetical protein